MKNTQFHLADLFEIAANAVPDRIAILGDDGPITYEALNRRTDALAAGLAEHGIARGDHVALYMMNGPAYLESFISTVKIGAVPYNINYRYQAEELRYLFRYGDAACIIHDCEFSPLVEQVRADLPKLKLSVCVGGGTCGQSLAYEAVHSDQPLPKTERNDEDYLLLYTGGTTGMPKGVMWPHKAFVFACAGGAGFFHPDGPIKQPDDITSRASQSPPLKMFTLAPLMHGAAIWSAWTALLSGLTVVLDGAKTFDPEAIWDRVEREGVNIIQVVGDAMAIPLRDALRDNPDRWQLQSVVNFGSGGALFSKHVQDDLLELLPNSGIRDSLGASETGISGTAEFSPDGLMRLPADSKQQIVIDDRLGTVGETGLVARRGYIPIGYYNDPEQSAEVFRMIDGDLWAVSGDRGRLDDDSKITVFGRGSTCINTGGEKVFPEEVEKELRAHPAISDAVVVAKPDEKWGQSVAAVLQQRPSQNRPDTSAIAEFLKTNLAGYKVPKTFVWVDNIARSPAGKPDIQWAKQKVEAAPAEE